MIIRIWGGCLLFGLGCGGEGEAFGGLQASVRRQSVRLKRSVHVSKLISESHDA